MAAFSHLDDLARNKRDRGFSRSHKRKKKHNSHYISQEFIAILQTCQAWGTAQAPNSQVGFNFQPTGTEKKVSTAGVFFIFIGTKADWQCLPKAKETRQGFLLYHICVKLPCPHAHTHTYTQLGCLKCPVIWETVVTGEKFSHTALSHTYAHMCKGRAPRPQYKHSCCPQFPAFLWSNQNTVPKPLLPFSWKTKHEASFGLLGSNAATIQETLQYSRVFPEHSKKRCVWLHECLTVISQPSHPTDPAVRGLWTGGLTTFSGWYDNPLKQTFQPEDHCALFGFSFLILSLLLSSHFWLIKESRKEWHHLSPALGPLYHSTSPSLYHSVWLGGALYSLQRGAKY